LDTNDWVRLYDAESQPAWVIDWSPNNKYIASGHFGGTVCIWNVNNNNCEGFIRAHFNSIDGLAWSDDSSLLATSSGAIRIWNAKTGEEKKAFGYAEDTIYSQLTWVSENVTATLESSYTQTQNNSRTIKFWDINSGDVQVAFRGWQEMKSVNYDGVALQINNIQISDTETVIKTSLVFDYPNVSALDWDVNLKDNTGKTYRLQQIDDFVVAGNSYHIYRTIPLPKDKTFTLELKPSIGLELTRDVSKDYAIFYFDPTTLKLGESVEMNQEIYANEYLFYLTKAEQISPNQIRFEFFTSYPISSFWLETPFVVGNTISEDGKGRFSSTLTFSKIPENVFEIIVEQVHYKAQSLWQVEFDLLDSMFVE
jgi:WD40 repeat protein